MPSVKTLKYNNNNNSFYSFFQKLKYQQNIELCTFFTGSSGQIYGQSERTQKSVKNH